VLNVVSFDRVNNLLDFIRVDNSGQISIGHGLSL